MAGRISVWEYYGIGYIIMTPQSGILFPLGWKESVGFIDRFVMGVFAKWQML